MPDPTRPGERSLPPQPHDTSPQTATLEDGLHRRAITHPAPSNFLPPPPPPHSTSPQTGLPPFASSFYSSHYSSGPHGTSSSAPANMNMNYGPGGHPLSAPPGGGYPYPVTSPMSHHGLPLPIGRPSHASHYSSESPRMPPGPPGAWSTSPGFRHLSPTSPTTHLAPPGMPASSSTSSSSFPSVTKTPGNLPGSGGGGKKHKRRSGSVDPSNESWDDEKYGMMDDMGEETGEQPWGMPQDEYKALNPRDKKQVRNR